MLKWFNSLSPVARKLIAHAGASFVCVELWKGAVECIGFMGVEHVVKFFKI